MSNVNTGATRYRIGIRADEDRRNDEGRPIPPIGTFVTGGIAVHYITASDDPRGKTSVREGQVLALTPAQVETLKRGLLIDRTPARVLDKVEARMVSMGDGSVTEKEVKIFRDAPYGRGPVVQWRKEVEPDTRHGPGRVSYSASVIDLSDKRYAPLTNPADEVAMANYVYLVPVAPDEAAPPPIDLAGIKPVKADVDDVADGVRSASFTPTIPDPLGIDASTRAKVTGSPRVAKS